MTTLGTLEELPLEYRHSLKNEHLAPLWPMLRDVLPHHAPKPLRNLAFGRIGVSDRCCCIAEHAPEGQPVELDYVNPETGDSCLPTMGLAAMLLQPGNAIRAPGRSSSSVFHVVEGTGHSTINGERFAWTTADTFSAPVFANVEHEASDAAAFLIRIHDAPLQQKLGFYEERPS